MKTSEVSVESISDSEKLRRFAHSIREGVTYVRKHAANAVNAACTIGANLSAARVYVQHGAWEKWIVEHTGLSPRTARAYMELNECLASVAPEDRQRVAELSVRRLIKAISLLKVEARAVTASALEELTVEQVTYDLQTSMEVVRNAIVGLEELASTLEAGSAADLRDLKSLSQKVRSALKVILDIKQHSDEKSEVVTLGAGC